MESGLYQLRMRGLGLGECWRMSGFAGLVAYLPARFGNVSGTMRGHEISIKDSLLRQDELTLDPKTGEVMGQGDVRTSDEYSDWVRAGAGSAAKEGEDK